MPWLWGPLSGDGMSRVIRGGVRICGGQVPFKPPYRRLRAVLAHWTHRKAWRGPSTHLHGHERVGDGASPVARQWGRSARSRRKKRAGSERAPPGVEPAAVDPSGSPTKWVGESLAPAK